MLLLSSTVSFMLFFLLLVLSIHMNEALGAQIEIRKLEETMVMRWNLEGNGFVTSKIDAPPSASRHCGGGKRFENMATIDRHDDQFSPLPGGDSSSLCIRCVTTQRCVGAVGAPPSTYTCTIISKQCENIPGH
ncbi:uncharacterized protein LOC9326671 isoform X2 [Arabidopsis lyrata subsp. lyrata]|uniref:uncharacterized protein LOC9326671 isoform X2 n=1 Tax=Arabidopsis lyrata subsp. lyrata TaxID=81972 RepID=UPI000A29B2C0|nr:uncharacterized protein LOC9326671 isoform X2 [Arabidopsis lyrata subsp. lyrata]|eukprot:XP_020870925.1 uncharacterized protein LOC9326671 isoform X2 [Arabidopsis lyrata subsp. lyrata]